MPEYFFFAYSLQIFVIQKQMQKPILNLQVIPCPLVNVFLSEKEVKNLS